MISFLKALTESEIKMGNILKMVQQQQIQSLTSLGWSDRHISRTIGVDRGTVSKYRKQHQSTPEMPTDPSMQNPSEVPAGDADQNQPNVPADQEQHATTPILKLPSTNSVQLHPYIETVKSLFDKRLTAQRIYQDLVEQHDYKGGYDSVKRYVRKLRKGKRDYVDHLEHLPGREAQVDFGKSTCFIKIKEKYRKVWFFKMTLSCSKHAYEELVERQDIETFIRCHERAFTFFGGVPEIVTIDNVKSGVIKAHLYEPILNQTYLAFANHWGFAANPCKPYTPEHKGIVERDISYTKYNALEGKRFESIEDGNLCLKNWNKRWARNRIHGTTKCQVWKLFCELEAPALHALAPTPFEYFNAGKRKVDVNGLVEVDARFYGVPPRHIGDQVVVHYNQNFVKIYDDGKHIITHRTLLQKGKVHQPTSCYPEWKHPDLESQERYYLSKAKAIGESMNSLVNAILSKNDPLAIRRVRGLFSLEKQYGNVILNESAEDALRSHVHNFHSIKRGCEHILQSQSDTTHLSQKNDLIRSLGDYEQIFEERTK